MVDTTATTIPTTSFYIERVRHRILELAVWDTEDKEASDEIEFSGPDSKLRKVTGVCGGVTIACTPKGPTRTGGVTPPALHPDTEISSRT